MALRESRMLLESDLLEEEKGFISTGLGGRENRLRYCFVIRSNDGAPFHQRQMNIIQEQFKRTCEELEAELESLSFQKNYLIANALISMDVAIGNFIERGIETCNKEEPCLKFHYYVTNVRPPTTKDIQEYLKEIEN